MRQPSFRVVRLLIAALAVVSLAAACGGGDDGGEDAADDTEDTTTTTEATTTTSTIDEAAETEAASKVAVDFFAAFGKADFDTTVALIENGEAHRPQFLHCENLTSAFSGIEMKDVVLEGDRASLTYDILGPDGAPLVEGSQGAAIKVDGTWLVAETTFLSLYDAAKDGCTGPPPPA